MSIRPRPDRPFTILISSAGRRVSLLRTFRQALDAIGIPGRVIACDLTELTAAMQMADVRHVVPRCDSPGFAAAMRLLCASEQVDLVIPTIDTELPIWAQLKGELAQAGTTVAVSSPSTIAIAADKRRTNAHCLSSGIPVPRQSTPALVSDIRSQWSLPLVVKPPMGSASNGLHIVRAWDELDHIVKNESHEAVIVEEFLPGVEHTVDVYVDRSGEVHCPVVRRRLEVRAGEVSKARVVRDDGLASLATKVVETLPGAYGVLNVQIFSDGLTAGLVEINARFGGGYPLTWRAGGRYSEWLIREVAFGEKPPAAPSIQDDLTMLRWDEEVFVEQ
jgi:carbamoyl-phosphate synthase large subunit